MKRGTSPMHAAPGDFELAVRLLSRARACLDLVGAGPAELAAWCRARGPRGPVAVAWGDWAAWTTWALALTGPALRDHVAAHYMEHGGDVLTVAVEVRAAAAEFVAG